MIHRKPPSDLSQSALFDSATFDQTAWWATQLHPSLVRSLEEGWQGVFRRGVLALMPVDTLAKHFHPDFGRPTKELYSMAALVLIMEFKDWTIDEAAQAYGTDAGIQYALHLPRNHQYLSPRCLDQYRRLVREDQSAGEVFDRVTVKLVAELDLEIKKQRLDSTHVLSNMASFGRTKLMAVTAKRFLVQLKRHDATAYEALPEELRQRYDGAESEIFGLRKKGQSAEAREEAKKQAAEDLYYLIERFGDEEKHRNRSSYQAMRRVFEEQCEIVGKKIRIREKAVDENGQSSGVLQNPSDAEAGYDGHKGAGYKVQLAQVCGEGSQAPLITACLPQSAGESDGAALDEVLDQQYQNQMFPEELYADTSYGSDANYCLCGKKDIELISPVPGRAPEKKESCQEAEKGPEAKAEQARSKPGPEAQPKERNQYRRQEEQKPEWREKYRERNGIEGTNRAIDVVTGFKELRVRGAAAVFSAIYAKVTGWNIIQSAKALAKRAIAKRKAAKKAAKEVGESLMRGSKRSATWMTDIMGGLQSRFGHGVRGSCWPPASAHHGKRANMLAF